MENETNANARHQQTCNNCLVLNFRLNSEPSKAFHLVNVIDIIQMSILKVNKAFKDGIFQFIFINLENFGPPDVCR